MSTLPELTDDELRDILDRLTLFAQKRVLRLNWRGMPASRGGTAPRGVEPQDLAVDALVDVIDGKRTWDQNKVPDLFSFLTSIINSKVNHLADSLENRVSRRIDSQPEIPAKHISSSPSETAANNRDSSRFKEEILKHLGNDPLVKDLLECFESDITKPAEIADVLGKDIREINNAQKRLRRAADKAVANFKKE